MAGTYSVGETKTRPGVYHRRYSVGGGELAGALNGVGMGLSLIHISEPTRH